MASAPEASPSPPPPSHSSSKSPPPPPPPPDSSSSPPPPSLNSTSPPPPPKDSSPSDEKSPPPKDSGSPPLPTNSSPSAPSANGAPATPVFSPPQPSTLASQPLGTSTMGDASSSVQSKQVAVIGGIVVGGVVILVLLLVCVICMQRRKKQQSYGDGKLPPKGGLEKKNQSPSADHPININPTPGGGWCAGLSSLPVARSNSDFSGQHPLPTPSPYGTKCPFTYEELATATSGFSQGNLLGQGGFGFVHKGILSDGREVAVKCLKAGSGQGDREFQAEVDIISRVHHRHLVSLVGYCIAGDKRILVYEFVPNKTLEFHLHGNGQLVMDWAMRLRIALGAAKGLAYLHEDCHPRIIHRDIKAANILLDDNFEAMVADFGLAKLTSDNFTHVSTRVMGTFGYLAPEYAASGKLTEKSDVYSFGVMLLELITGHKPVDPTNRTMEDSLVDWARPLLSKVLEDGDYSELVDPRLGDNYVPHEMARMVACAAAGIRHSARRRPRMSQIVCALDGVSSLEDLNEGTKSNQSQAYSTPSPAMNREIYDTQAYNVDMMKFKKMVIQSEEGEEDVKDQNSSSSEYGCNASSSSSGDSTEIAHHNLNH